MTGIETAIIAAGASAAAAAGGTAAATAGITTAAAAGTTASALLAAPAGLGAAAGFSATAGGLTAGSLLTYAGTGLSLASGAMSLFGGNAQGNEIMKLAEAQNADLAIAAENDRLDAREEEIRGKREGNDILERVNSALAAQRIAQAAKGLDVGFGTSLDVTESTVRRGEVQVSNARDDARMRALSRRRSAMSRRLSIAENTRSASVRAGQARSSGVTNAVGTVADQVFRGLNRG